MFLPPHGDDSEPGETSLFSFTRVAPWMSIPREPGCETGARYFLRYQTPCRLVCGFLSCLAVAAPHGRFRGILESGCSGSRRVRLRRNRRIKPRVSGLSLFFFSSSSSLCSQTTTVVFIVKRFYLKNVVRFETTPRLDLFANEFVCFFFLD